MILKCAKLLKVNSVYGIIIQIQRQFYKVFRGTEDIFCCIVHFSRYWGTKTPTVYFCSEKHDRGW